jgi:large conductance mechanosensitive channel
MGFIQDFKEFAFKGNLIDMAVGIVMGTAVAAMVKSFLENIISPIIAVVAGVPDMSSLKHKLAEVDVTNAAGEVVKEGAFIKYGTFIQNTIDFAILALVVFIAIKIASSWMASDEDEEPSDEVKLLTEIRDSLAKGA